MKQAAEKVTIADLPALAKELRNLGANDIADRVDATYAEADARASELSSEIGASASGMTTTSMSELGHKVPGGFFASADTKVFAAQLAKRINSLDKVIAERHFLSSEAAVDVPMFTPSTKNATPRVHAPRLAIQLPGATVVYIDAKGEVAKHVMSANWDSMTDMKTYSALLDGVIRDRGVEIPIDKIRPEGIRQTRQELGLSGEQIRTLINHISAKNWEGLRGELIKMSTPQLAAFATYIWPRDAEVFDKWHKKLRGDVRTEHFSGAIHKKGKLAGRLKKAPTNAMGTLYVVINERFNKSQRFGPTTAEGKVESTGRAAAHGDKPIVEQPKVEQRTESIGVGGDTEALAGYLAKQHRILTKGLDNAERSLGANAGSRKIARKVYDAIAKLSTADLNRLRPRRHGKETPKERKARKKAGESRKSGPSAVMRRWAKMSERDARLRSLGVYKKGKPVNFEETAGSRALGELPEIIGHVIKWRDTGHWEDVMSDVSAFRGVEKQLFDKPEIFSDAARTKEGETAELSSAGRGMVGGEYEADGGVYTEPGRKATELTRRKWGQGKRAGFQKALAVANYVLSEASKQGKKLRDPNEYALLSLIRDNPNAATWETEVQHRAGSLIEKIDTAHGEGSTKDILEKHKDRSFIEGLVLSGRSGKEAEFGNVQERQPDAEAASLRDRVVVPVGKGQERQLSSSEVAELRRFQAIEMPEGGRAPGVFPRGKPKRTNVRTLERRLDEVIDEVLEQEASTDEATSNLGKRRRKTIFSVRKKLSEYTSLLRTMAGEGKYQERDAKGERTGPVYPSLIRLTRMGTQRIRNADDAAKRAKQQDRLEAEIARHSMHVANVRMLRLDEMIRAYEVLGEEPPSELWVDTTKRSEDAVVAGREAPPEPTDAPADPLPPSGRWPIAPEAVFYSTQMRIEGQKQAYVAESSNIALVEHRNDPGVIKPINLDETLPLAREMILAGEDMGIAEFHIHPDYLHGSSVAPPGKYAELAKRLTSYKEVMRIIKEDVKNDPDE
jgi:hypothetical protein